ncbi:MAG: hypothetical protein WDW38_006440 [Sanguina aurantia]
MSAASSHRRIDRRRDALDSWLAELPADAAVGLDTEFMRRGGRRRVAAPAAQQREGVAIRSKRRWARRRPGGMGDGNRSMLDAAPLGDRR